MPWMLEDFFGNCRVVTQNFGTLQQNKKKSVLWNFNPTETYVGLCLMTNPGFRPTASGGRFCSSLDLTETHFHLGKRAEEEQSSGCHLDFLSKPGRHTESILHSPHRWQHLSSALSPAPWARRWAAGDTLGCPGGAWHRHPMLPTIPLPAPLTGQQWGSCWASPKQHLGEMAAPRGLCLHKAPIDWQDAMVGDGKYTQQVTNLLGPLCWQAQIFSLQ